MNKFSEDLMVWVKNYFKKHYGVNLTDEEAEQALHDFASFYRAFSGFIEDKDREGSLADGRPPDSLT